MRLREGNARGTKAALASFLDLVESPRHPKRKPSFAANCWATFALLTDHVEVTRDFLPKQTENLQLIARLGTFGLVRRAVFYGFEEPMNYQQEGSRIHACSYCTQLLPLGLFSVSANGSSSCKIFFPFRIVSFSKYFIFIISMTWDGNSTKAADL